MTYVKHKKLFSFIFNFIVSLVITFGFVTIFSLLLKESLADVFILITLPIIVGSLLINNPRFKNQGMLFLFSSIFLILGFLMMFGASGDFAGHMARIILYFGAFSFSWGLLILWEKVVDEVFKTKAYMG